MDIARENRAPITSVQHESEFVLCSVAPVAA
jgi:hypothetical protein